MLLLPKKYLKIIFTDHCLNITQVFLGDYFDKLIVFVNKDFMWLASVKIGQVSLHVIVSLNVSEPVSDFGDKTGFAEWLWVEDDAGLFDLFFNGELE